MVHFGGLGQIVSSFFVYLVYSRSFIRLSFSEKLRSREEICGCQKKYKDLSISKDVICACKY